MALLYRAGVSARAFDIIRAVSPSTRIIFHPVDLHFLRTARQAEITGDPVLAQSAEEMRVQELSLLKRADARIVVSAAEQAVLQTALPGLPVTLIPIMRPIPPERPAPGFLNRRDIAFVGAFAHKPNADGIIWFVREVWPILTARGFKGRLLIAGAFITPEISALARANIVVRGHVPDLPTFLDGVRLSIAPLRYGAGVKGKIVSSLSLRLPVVATAIAAEGMALRHGEDVLIGETVEGMAEQILKAYSDQALWQHLAANGYETFLRQFSETAGERKLLHLLADLQHRQILE
ncbi:glycosyltransferase [Aestuariivirga sp.]|uniref:glycosyltransferase n=1 Tax=Aestuariivirga sp. TaxID=2650926 RepID=UPI0039E342AF